MSKTLREKIQELPLEVNGNGWAVLDRADVLRIVAEHERETSIPKRSVSGARPQGWVGHRGVDTMMGYICLDCDKPITGENDPPCEADSH